MDDGSFRQAIEAHRELQRRNSLLEASMPIAGYLETVAGEFADVATASRAVAAEPPENDPPTQRIQRAALWNDPNSWWDTHEPGAAWAT